MSPLERRCRLLMRAYPAAYRRERGEEIIATLLEATPEGRRRPLGRDMRALIMGGLRVRAAQNKRFTTAVSLRLAVLAGISIYLGVVAAEDLAGFLYGELRLGTPVAGTSAWLLLLAGLLTDLFTVAAVVLAWLARRPFVIGAALAAAAAMTYGFSLGQGTGFPVTELVCLAAVVALTSGTERPSPAWLWLIGIVAATQVLPSLLQYPSYWPNLLQTPSNWPYIHQSWLEIAFGLDLCVAVLTVAWVAMNARPLVAVATYVLLSWVPANLVPGVRIWSEILVLLVPALAASLAVWRLRRQSLRPGQARQ